MKSQTELKAGDPCPNCGGEMIPDVKQDPQRLAELKKRNSPNPAAAARFADNVTEKAEKFGVIHTCTNCGYSARFPAADAESSRREGETAGGGGEGAATGAGEGEGGSDGEGRSAGASGRSGSRGSHRGR